MCLKAVLIVATSEEEGKSLNWTIWTAFRTPGVKSRRYLLSCNAGADSYQKNVIRLIVLSCSFASADLWHQKLTWAFLGSSSRTFSQVVIKRLIAFNCFNQCNIGKLYILGHTHKRMCASKVNIILQGTVDCRRRAQTNAGRCNACMRPTMEGTGPHPPPRVTPDCTANTFKLRQAYPDSLFGDVPDLDPKKATEIHTAEISGRDLDHHGVTTFYVGNYSKSIKQYS